MRKFLLLFVSLALFALLNINNIALSQSGRPLEISYPTVPDAPTPTTVETPLPNYVKYIFNFFIWGSGFVALLVLVIAGVQYMISAGRPEVMKDAKDRIFSALLGLAILLSSWLILTTINPDLKNLQIKELPVVVPSLPGGVYLCKEGKGDEIYSAWNRIQEIKKMSPNDPSRKSLIQQVNNWLIEIDKYCWYVPASTGEIPTKINDLAKMAYTVPSETNQLYGAVLYDESKFQGKAQVVYKTTPQIGRFGITAIKPSSVRTFVLKEPRAGVYVQLFELIDFNKADTKKKSQVYTLSELARGEYIEDFDEVGSVKIEGELLVIFFKEEYRDPKGWPPDAILDVVFSTDANLHDNLMGRWCTRSIWQFWETYPCPKQMAIVSGGAY